MTTATLILSPNASTSTKVAYSGFAFYMRSEFEKRIEADAKEEARTGTRPANADANLEAFAYWDLQYKLKDEELTAHYSKFEIGALLNKIDNA